MSLRPVQIAFNAADDVALGAFWAELLGYASEEEEPGVTCLTPQDADYLAPGTFGVDVVRTPDPETTRYRVHLDLGAADHTEYSRLIDKALALGARRANIGQGDAPWEVLADPEGNLFCVLKPTAQAPSIEDVRCPIAQVVIHCADPQRLASFWDQALDWVRSDAPWAPASHDVVRFRSASGTGPFLTLLRTEEPDALAGRAHLDLRPYAGGDRADESARLRTMGATDLDLGQGDAPWTVLADPEGNPFCVLSPGGHPHAP
ncbi:VOC family protein [Zhihengliuella flava]|uniref:Enzyme related to lactoylglutathione lyase n=1 Tax=Zhihengliuella flava TaxID=1285193 RepID=A0A931GDS6_9MICC|nr:VOC family protein [Zhihengliuella flava]MBG6083748.1 putative enzyme related to lactoylglutathione lyase [Zhihengliuella flava]